MSILGAFSLTYPQKKHTPRKYRRRFLSLSSLLSPLSVAPPPDKTCAMPIFSKIPSQSDFSTDDNGAGHPDDWSPSPLSNNHSFLAGCNPRLSHSGPGNSTHHPDSRPQLSHPTDLPGHLHQIDCRSHSRALEDRRSHSHASEDLPSYSCASEDRCSHSHASEDRRSHSRASRINNLTLI